ncbi:MAG: hypothetical protein RL272_1193 [Candidatus Parcubacteria bacterium]|jgi:hypothetical protein
MANDMPSPCNASCWWDEADATVGTGSVQHDYLFSRRVHLQLAIASRALCPKCGKDTESEPPPRSYGRKCGFSALLCTEDGSVRAGPSTGCGAALSSIDARDVISGVRCWLENEDMPDAASEKALALLVVDRLSGMGLAEAAAATFDDLGGRPTLIDEAVRAALKDWAAKFHERALRLPRMPEPEPYRYPLWQRILRRIPFFRGVGL